MGRGSGVSMRPFRVECGLCFSIGAAPFGNLSVALTRRESKHFQQVEANGGLVGGVTAGVGDCAAPNAPWDGGG